MEVCFTFRNSRFTIMGSGSLAIENVQANDNGQYTCRAMNSEDSADTSALVAVHSKHNFIQITVGQLIQ